MISIHEIATKFPLPRHGDDYIRLFLNCLKQVSALLPVDAQEALLIAERHWHNSREGSASLSLVRTCILTRVAQAQQSGDLAETPYRLVSFVLELPAGGAIDHLEWFEVYMERIGADPAIFKLALIEAFRQASD